MLSPHPEPNPSTRTATRLSPSCVKTEKDEKSKCQNWPKHKLQKKTTGTTCNTIARKRQHYYDLFALPGHETDEK